MIRRAAVAILSLASLTIAVTWVVSYWRDVHLDLSHPPKVRLERNMLLNGVQGLPPSRTQWWAYVYVRHGRVLLTYAGRDVPPSVAVVRPAQANALERLLDKLVYRRLLERRTSIELYVYERHLWRSDPFDVDFPLDDEHKRALADYRRGVTRWFTRDVDTHKYLLRYNTTPYFEAAVVFPLWPPFVAFAIWPAVALLWRPLRRWCRRRRGLCGRCGYDLTGNVSGVCPECGTPTSPP